MNLKAFISLFAIGYLSFGKVGAQETVIKTNLLYDVTANANIAVETRIAPLWLSLIHIYNTVAQVHLMNICGRIG